MFHIFSPYFLQVFFQFLQLFQMTKMKCFQRRSTNVCKNTVKVKAAFCSNEFLLCQKCVIFWLHGFCVNQPCTCCGNVLETSHIWHLVCVCVRMNFSAICRLAHLTIHWGYHFEAPRSSGASLTLPRLLVSHTLLMQMVQQYLPCADSRGPFAYGPNGNALTR